MHWLFIADPLEAFKPEKETTFAMMLEAQMRNHQVSHALPSSLHWESGGLVQALSTPIRLHSNRETASWFERTDSARRCALRDFDGVVMRKNPPFDSEYVYATHLLSQAEAEGARIFNHPLALREYPEKLALMRFSQWAPPTLVSSQMPAIKDFFRQHKNIILKPLDGMGGMGIFRIKEDGLNLGSVIETLTKNGRETIMAQCYLPEIEMGDKRILLINGEPIPYALARIPQNGEVRGNLAVGGKGVAQALSEQDWAIARAVGPSLAQAGLLLVGLDVIGKHLTEVNVTSPTGFQEITKQTGLNVAGVFCDALQAATLSKH